MDGETKFGFEENFCYNICLNRFFGKVAGLLGTINNENFDDMQQSDNTIAVNEEDFVRSWKDSACEEVETTISSKKTDATLVKTCGLFFKQKTSYFATCFSIVDPDRFYDMCLEFSSSSNAKSQNVNNADELLNEYQHYACSVGISYIEACSMTNIPLRIPESCIQ